MLSLVPLGLAAEQPVAPAQSAIAQKITVQAISLRDALLVGIVTGFALSAGGLIFKKIARRYRWD